MQALLNLYFNIPGFTHIADGKVREVNVLDEISPEAGAFCVVDRACLDFARLCCFTVRAAFFAVRTKRAPRLRQRSSRPVDKRAGIRSDPTVVLATVKSTGLYPATLRPIGHWDPCLKETVEVRDQ
jgi:hypothetical protein